MELSEAIQKRTSVRSFSDEVVNIDDIREIVRRGGLAPSVNNFQPWRLIFVKDKELLNELAEIISVKYESLEFREMRAGRNIMEQVRWYSTFFKSAPGLLVLIMTKYETVLEKGSKLSHEKINEMRNYPDMQSAGACVQNILLSAVDLGYGACWLSGPLIAKEEISHRLGIAEDEKLVCFIAIGKSSKDFQPKQKNDLGKSLQIL